MRVFCFLLSAAGVDKKKTLTQPSPAKAGEGYFIAIAGEHS